MGFLTYLIGLSGLAGAIILYWRERPLGLNARKNYRILRLCIITPVRALVRCQNANFSPRHFFFMNAYSLTDVINLTLHLSYLGRLQIQHL